MKNKTVLEHLKAGKDSKDFFDALDKSKREIAHVSSVISQIVALDPYFSQFSAEELLLGVFTSGLNGLNIANMSKEDVLKILDQQWERSVQLKAEYMKALETVDPDEDALQTIQKQAGVIATMPTDGKVH